MSERITISGVRGAGELGIQNLGGSEHISETLQLFMEKQNEQ